MEKTDQLAAIVRRWAQIKKRWDDKKADFIEREYIEPLSACTAAISDKAAEVSDFVALIENRLEETENI